jgi:CDP-diacylglycerol---serine O-phosphatidyltransferase
MGGVFGPIGFLPPVALASACALRLARFNVAASEPDRPAWKDGYFTGIPAPAGAFVSLLPIYVDFAGTDATLAAQKLALLSVPLTAFLMVSRIPTFSGKHLSRKLLRRWFLPTFAAAILAVFGLLSAPWLTFALGVAAYIATLPMSSSRYKVLSVRKPLG